VTLGGGACGDRPFAPAVRAGVTDAAAGGSTGFALEVRREDRTAELGAISSVTLPPGLVADVGSVALCGAAGAAAGDCPAGSRVGRVEISAGPGAQPLGLAGTAYLTEGYKNAPFGLALVVRALAGPYDLGTVVVRSAVHVGRDARLRIETDPLPTALAGIPLRLRAVRVVLDRAGFMRNPTSCDPGPVAVRLLSTGGAAVDATSRFGLRGCRGLPFRPRMTASAKRSNRKVGAQLAIHLTQPAGQANLKSVAVTLPQKLSVRLAALGTVCSADQLAADRCPAAAQVGSAKAQTPILGAPLAGPVYLAQSGGTLPSLVAVLRGSGLTIQLDGTVSMVKGRVVTTFASVPDVPIRTFDLVLPQGRRSVLAAPQLPCRGAALSVLTTGQNGARTRQTVPLGGIPCRKAERQR
jgi:hypothetical protein